MNRKGLIYIAKDKIIGKVYIGQTKNRLEVRKKQHLKHAKNKLDSTYFSTFYKMIRFFGENNFEWKILEDDIPEEKLNEREIFYIKKYNSYQEGYNSSGGGQRSHNSKIPKKDVKEIRKLLEETNLSMLKIAEKFPNCNSNIVSDINCGETWYDPSISYPIRPMGFNKRINFSDDEILEIHNLLRTDLPIKDIAKKFNCHPFTITKINTGETYKILNENEYPIRDGKYKRTDDKIVLEITNLLLDTDYTQIQIAEKVGVNRKIVSNINNGKYYSRDKLRSINLKINSFPIRNK